MKNKKVPTYNVTYDEIQKYIKQGRDLAIRDATNFAIAGPMLILRDEFGFGGKRLMRFYEAYSDLYDSIEKGYLTINDIVQTIKEEVDIELIRR